MILNKSQTALARLNRIKEASEDIEESKTLDQLMSDLLGLAKPIYALASSASLLSRNGVALSSATDISKTTETVKQVSERFIEMPKSNTLKQGQRWTGLTKKLQGFSKQMSELQSEDWVRYFKNIFRGLPPSQRESHLAPTPENKAALEKYKALYQDYIKYRTAIPENDGEFNNLTDVVNKLSKIEFKEDVPEDVRRFLSATNTGADLDLLTIEVIDWLRKNKMLSGYFVKAKHC